MAGGSPDDIRAHIESIATRSNSESRRLAQHLNRRSWPGGADDHTEPIALGWLQQWHPSGPAPATPLCACASGRCLVCN
jgi:hypothetical protein